jgi:hypothetical protein
MGVHLLKLYPHRLPRNAPPSPVGSADLPGSEPMPKSYLDKDGGIATLNQRQTTPKICGLDD